MRTLLLTLTILVVLAVAPAAQAVPIQDLPGLTVEIAQQVLTEGAADEALFPPSFPELNATYHWTAEGTWAVGAGPSGNFHGPDRDDNVILISFPPELTTGIEDPRQTIVLVATFEDIAHSLAPVPEPTTWILLGTGMAAGLWFVRRRRRRLGPVKPLIVPTEELAEDLARRFAARAVRLARYRRWLAAVGLGVTVLGWVAWVDAAACSVVWNPATRTYRQVCR